MDQNQKSADQDLLLKALDVDIDQSLKDQLAFAFKHKEIASEEHADSPGFPRAASTKGRLVLEAYQDSPKIAAYMLLTFCDIPFTPDSREAIEGVLNARLYAKGFTKNVAPERDELRRLRNEAADFIRELKSIKQSAVELHQEAERTTERQLAVCRAAGLKAETEVSDRISLAVAANSAQIDQFMKDRLASFDNNIEGVKNELEQLKAHYTSSIALEAPVAFWAENQREHQQSAKDFLRWILIAGPTSIGALFWIGWSFLANTVEHHWGKTTLFIFLSASMMWLLRILIRLYLSHKHLEVDARERIVLAKTYLSLLADGVGPPEDQRKIVFQALFRPSTTGIIKEDEHPNPMIELVTKTAGGKS